MRSNRLRWTRHGFCLALLLTIAGFAGCVHKMAQDTPPPAKRDINAVLADHDDELLAIGGVVGVYAGLLDDGRTPCIKVMLARKTPAAERAIPCTLEGYPVVTEITGEIRPLEKR
jgi:hypothetical protein